MSSKLETILQGLELGELASRFAAEGVDDSLLGHLTEDDLEKIGIDKLGHRKRFLAAVAESGLEVAVSRVGTNRDPSAATRENPFVNGLGLPFVPLDGYATLLCVWQLRVRDYQVYCEETAGEFPPCDFPQGPDHPVVNVSWDDATEFCRWLTKRERAHQRISRDFVYRLPEDREWSAAVGLDREVGRSPGERSGKSRGYPWGAAFPPPRGAGNYHQILAVDDFRETAPVGSFPANPLGIFDLGGNVWEWCLDQYDAESRRRVLRGASCFNDDDEYLLSSFRDKNAPDNRRNNNGIRLALGVAHESGPWF